MSAAAEGAAPAPAPEAPAPRPAWHWWGLALSLVPVAGGLTYWILYSPMLGTEQKVIDLKPLEEGIFDTTDNLLVFFLDSADDLLGRQADMQRVMRSCVEEPQLKKVNFFYNIRKEGDPPVPDTGKGSAGDSPDDVQPLKVVLYKGQRRSTLRVGGEVPVQELVDFFQLLSETIPKTETKRGEIQRISAASYPEDVLGASTPSRPILLQLYEDSCFLCFLMRPFVNSLAELFVTYNVPITVKRLNIEKNDFPDGCPVARGTPTFVYCRGRETPPRKWEEFKPKELVEKLSQEFPRQQEEFYSKMDELQGLVAKRFQLFTQQVMWSVEVQKLEELLASGEGPASSGAGAGAASAGGEDPDSPEESDFNRVVMEMMAKDMRRVDGIHANLQHLQREVEEVEHDAALLGAWLAELVQRREAAEP